MLQKINSWILIALTVFFGFCLYKLIISNQLYPFALLLFFTLLSIGMYFSINLLKKINPKIYLAISLFSFINCIILFADYIYPEILKSTWNYSLSLVFFIILYALLVHIKKTKGKLSLITYWITLFSGILIELILLMKTSNSFIHSLVFYLFLISSILILTLSSMRFNTTTE